MSGVIAMAGGWLIGYIAVSTLPLAVAAPLAILGGIVWGFFSNAAFGSRT